MWIFINYSERLLYVCLGNIYDLYTIVTLAITGDLLWNSNKYKYYVYTRNATLRKKLNIVFCNFIVHFCVFSHSFCFWLTAKILAFNSMTSPHYFLWSCFSPQFFSFYAAEKSATSQRHSAIADLRSK